MDGFSAKDIFFFDKMLTPKIITLVYWLILFSSAISGLGMMINGYGFIPFIMGLFTIFGGIIFGRIWCELMIVLFKINGNLQTLTNKKLSENIEP